jgi:uncharacterized protein (DUF4213/DUF364 family)
MTDAFGDTLDDELDDEASSNEADATEAFIERSNSDGAVRDRTVGFGVAEEMHYLYRELSDSDDVDADLRQQFRDQIERMANRHPDVADRARQKYELDNE